VAEKELYWHKLRRRLAMVVRGINAAPVDGAAVSE
jgi:hypothetical protein